MVTEVFAFMGRRFRVVAAGWVMVERVSLLSCRVRALPLHHPVS